MDNTLTWLHLSDLHLSIKTKWKANDIIEKLKLDLSLMNQEQKLKPDLLFFTGDLAFGQLGDGDLSIQAQFTEVSLFLNKICALFELSNEQIFIVAGNHDINRKRIAKAQSIYLESVSNNKSYEDSVEEINSMLDSANNDWQPFMLRFSEYQDFLQANYSHLLQDPKRLTYAINTTINGVKVGIAGFNSVWNCEKENEKGKLWLGGKWQINTLSQQLNQCHVKIALSHHPLTWLVPQENPALDPILEQQFNFFLHGHEHHGWVDIKTDSEFIRIAAGACYGEKPSETGYSFVRLDFTQAKGEVWLRKFDDTGLGWIPRVIPQKTNNDGLWVLNDLKWLAIKPSVENQPIATVVIEQPEVSTVIHIPVETEITTTKQFSIPSEPEPQFIKPIPITPPFTKSNFKLYGRESLINDAIKKLNQQPFLLVYGLRGNGKSKLIEALAQESPLKNKELHRFSVSPYTTADELFRQIATLLGETAEFPKAPQGDIASITDEIKRRYPNPRPAWLWIEHAHHLLNGQGFRHSEVRLLLLGLHAVLGTRWHFVLELRERPPQNLLGCIVNECEVLGLDKSSLKQWLQDAAPSDTTSTWSFKSDELSRINQWLGGGHGGQAHTLATQLLIDVAIGQAETPLQVLERHRDFLDKGIENLLLGDLYSNVLNADEQKLLQAFALYRSAIPYDHVEILGQHLNEINVMDAWEGLDRRCLLSANAEHSKYYLHSFIAGWLRTRQLGYDVANDEDDNNDFSSNASSTQKQLARTLHLAIAKCWLAQLGKTPRIDKFSITRALEAFHHFIAAGNAEQVQSIAVELLASNQEWAEQRITQLCNYLFKIHAPITQQRATLQYAVHLNPNNPKFQRFLGECWAKEEGWDSYKALACFEQACRLSFSYSPNWANLGKALLNHGRNGAEDFLTRLEQVTQQYPKVIDDHVRSIQSDCLKLAGNTEKATALRMERINSGSKDPVFYANEAKARLEAGDSKGALDILNRAQQRNCTNEFTDSILITILQARHPERASTLRMEYINAGSKDAVFYNDEALALYEASNYDEALTILDKAEQNGCVDAYTVSIRTKILQAQNR